MPSARAGFWAGSLSCVDAEHRLGRREEGIEVEADQPRRHEPDVRQRRVATADVGRVQEHLAQVVVVGDRVEAAAAGP